MPGTRQPGRQRELITVTASTTLTNFDVGKTVCNVGAAGAVTITLPTPASCRGGDDILVLSCADQDLIVASGTADTMIVLNDIAADSVALSTASEKAGGGFLFTCVGTLWHCAPMTEETQTVTVVTA
jgi:hypothetical protein